MAKPINLRYHRQGTSKNYLEIRKRNRRSKINPHKQTRVRVELHKETKAKV